MTTYKFTICCCSAWSLLCLFNAPHRYAYSLGLCASAHRRVLEYSSSYSSSTRPRRVPDSNSAPTTVASPSSPPLASVCQLSVDVGLQPSTFEFVAAHVSSGSASCTCRRGYLLPRLGCGNHQLLCRVRRPTGPSVDVYR